MRFTRFCLLFLAMMPAVCVAANGPEFESAAKLLTAAKNANVQQVQALINSGADVNYVDATGLSLVCTALMNKDTRAVQILQMYGADASQCDVQIKKYKNLTNPQSSSGLFSGLSSAQSLTLAAGAGAVGVGGVVLLASVFNPSNKNGGGTNSGGHGGQGGGGGGSKLEPDFTLPYGPAMPNATSESNNYTENLNLYSSVDEHGVDFESVFKLMNADGQNYLLMMHGYSPFARGYMGQETLRNTLTHVPILDISGGSTRLNPTGGKPVNVALVTANGINATANSSLADQFMVWTKMNETGDGVIRPTDSMISSKYYNNKIENGKATEDGYWVDKFDMSGSGTVIHNTFATDVIDNKIAKIVGGRTPFEPEEGSYKNDFIGFMPNGQMLVLRTGNGKGFVEFGGDDGEYHKKIGADFATGDTITLFDTEWTLTVTGNTFTAESEATTDIHTGYIGANGLLYINSVAGGVVDTAYSVDTPTDDGVGRLTYTKDLQVIDYANYAALRAAGDRIKYASSSEIYQSVPSVIANASVIEPLNMKSVAVTSDLLNYNYGDNRKNAFKQFVDSAYDLNEQDGEFDGDKIKDLLPSLDADKFFTDLGYAYDPIVVFSSGAHVLNNKDDKTILPSTFENAAPLVYGDLNHLFMTIVPVALTGEGGGTKSATDISSFVPTDDKYSLSVWAKTVDNSTTIYKGRYYGYDSDVAKEAQRLNVDPWGFAAAGQTDEMAVAAAAGAVGAVQGAFNYLNNKQIFTLLALTADGPYLGTKSNGVAYTEDELAAYLDSMFDLPEKYNHATTAEEYLNNFQTVYGYGLINLERATTPNKSVFFYNNKKQIVSGDGTAYWRIASDTAFNLTGAFGGRGETISMPFYDILTSVNGEMSMPRIWENEFTLGGDSKRGLYMGDVLGDFKVRKDDAQKMQFGDMAFSMSVSQRPYADNLNGLDNLSLSYDNDKFGLNAGFQRYFTDGQSRFSGLSNPVLGLATNAIVTGGEYKYGNWSFGARAFSGSITDESFLQNDPTVSAQYEPLRLGLAQGGQSNIGWDNDKFSVAASFGVMHETDTVLGAQTTGLLNIGNGDTTYVDVVSTYKPIENVSLTLRSTFARTHADATGDLIMGLSKLNSNAFAFGADVGNFSFSISRPLAITDGNLQYAYAKYDIVETGSGKYDLVIADAGARNLNLIPSVRETRLMGAYRHNFGEFTDGALGFIYRINPNNTNVFGNESIFMLKLTHRLGI